MKIVNITPPQVPPAFTPKTLEITLESQEELNSLTRLIAKGNGYFLGMYIALKELGGNPF